MPDADDLVRRYCGLRWSGGADETWAYRYFDAVADSDPDTVLEVDVLAAAALSPAVRAGELDWFWHARGILNGLLARLPRDLSLEDADEGVSDSLWEIPALAATGRTAPLSAVSKVLHRKRPGLVPLFDKATVDHYRSVVRTRGDAAWPGLVQTFRSDLIENAVGLNLLRESLASELTVVPTGLRIADIAIWMSVHSRRSA